MKSYTKYRQSIVAIMIISGLLLFPLTARAAETIVYEQAPGHIGGYGADGPVFTVADDFQLADPTLITNITWWGGYASKTSSPAADKFTMRLYTDNGGQPGALIQVFNIGINAVRTATGDWVNPPERRPGRPEFQYSFDLPTAFFVDANTRYWLSIVNDVPGPDDWVWEESASLINPGVQRSFQSGPWEPASRNTAFQLQNSGGTPFLPVQIDIQPGSFPNTISLSSSGTVPVAILSSLTFDAPSQVDQAALEKPLTFGRTGDEQSFLSCSSPQDANGDGLPDLVCLFKTQATGFQLGDFKGVLKGRTITGRSLIGSDSVRIVP